MWLVCALGVPLRARYLCVRATTHQRCQRPLHARRVRFASTSYAGNGSGEREQPFWPNWVCQTAGICRLQVIACTHRVAVCAWRQLWPRRTTRKRWCACVCCAAARCRGADYTACVCRAMLPRGVWRACRRRACGVCVAATSWCAVAGRAGALRVCRRRHGSLVATRRATLQHPAACSAGRGDNGSNGDHGGRRHRCECVPACLLSWHGMACASSHRGSRQPFLLKYMIRQGDQQASHPARIPPTPITRAVPACGRTRVVATAPPPATRAKP